MANTVVGIFEYESDAQEAQNYLLANGFAGGDVDIKIASYKSDQETSTVNNDDDDILDRIGNFFRHLFDGDEEETKRYSEAGRRGTIVTVHAEDPDEAVRAAAILDEYGAVDVNKPASSDETNPDYVANAGFGSTQAYAGDDKYSDTESYKDDVTAVPVNAYTDTTVDPYANRSMDIVTDDSQSESVPVRNDDLRDGNREMETGGVSRRSRIIERQVQESFRLRQQHANRTPLDHNAPESDFDTFTKGNVEKNEHLTDEERLRRSGFDL